MPVPDFSPGEVLTAAAMDSIGLWLVKSQTVGTGVSTVVVNDAFNTNFESYKVITRGIVFSSLGAAVYIKLSGTTGSTYFGNILYNVPTSAALGGVSAQNGNNLGFFVNVASSSGPSDFEATITNPFLASASNCFGTYAGQSYNGNFGTHDSNAASSTGFTLLPGAGTMTGGKILVYGIRN
jgi:hypothetical protein